MTNWCVFACTDRSRKLLDGLNLESVIVYNQSTLNALKNYEINYSQIKEELVVNNIDICLVLGWHELIPKSLLDLEVTWIGRHLSLLPQRRGRAPVSWALIEGLDTTGVTFFELEENIDSGDILAQSKVEINEDDDAHSLHSKLNQASVELLEKYIPKWSDGEFEHKPNPDSEATFTHPRRPDMGLIDWTKSAKTIHNFIRAQTKPYPGTFTYHKMDKIICWSSYKTDYDTLNHEAGTVLDISKDDVIEVSCDDNPILVQIEKVQDRWEIEVGDVLGRCV